MSSSFRLRAPVSLATLAALSLAVSGCTDQGASSASTSTATSSASASATATASDTASAPATTRPAGAETAQAAAGILAKLVADQAAAITATGADGDAKRAAVYSGKALEMAQAQVKLASTLSDADRGDLALSGTGAVVLAVSRGAAYPRTIIAAANKATSATPVLLLLSAADPTAGYRIAASASLLGGASVGQFEGVAIGSAAPGEGPLAIAPDALLGAYAAALAYPSKDPVDPPFGADSFSAALLTAERNQVHTAARGATLRSTHTPVGVAGGLRLPPGKGALIFVVLERKDVITDSTANSLTPTKAFTVLSGKSIIQSRAELHSYEMVAFVVPESGKAQAVAAEDQLYAASGT
jgi:hypothetical protein